MVDIAIIILATGAIIAAMRLLKRWQPWAVTLAGTIQLLTFFAGLGFAVIVFVFLVDYGGGYGYGVYASEIVASEFTAQYPTVLRRELHRELRLGRPQLCTIDHIAEWERGLQPACLVAKHSPGRCPFWWIRRRCGAVLVASELYANENVRRLIEESARFPCRTLPHADDLSGLTQALTGIGCRDASTPQPIDVAIDVGGPNWEDPRTRAAIISRSWWWAKDIWWQIAQWLQVVGMN